MCVGSSFFAMLSRMKSITRWALMRNTREESICEHSYDVAVLAHGLAELTNRRFGGCVNVERCVLLALYHDTTEIFTGDLPTPVKYDNPVLKEAYKRLEGEAADRLLRLLPEDLRAAYAPLYTQPADSEEARLVKAADKLSALIKCVEETEQGNREFTRAEASTLSALQAMQLPAVDCFLSEFLPAYRLTLDEQEDKGEQL